MSFLLPLVEEIKHNVRVFEKLVGTEYEYYCVYIFCNILKFFAYFKVSHEKGEIVRVFNYLKEVEYLLEPSELGLVRLAVSLSRRNDRLRDNYNLVDLSQVRNIISKLLKEVEK